MQTKNLGELSIDTFNSDLSKKIILKITTRVGSHSKSVIAQIDKEGLEKLSNYLILARYELEQDMGKA
tara:strand:+ start:600 stop:803 length:204 start_codon:yes stop_codon:yes gene_type:complete